MCVLKGIDMDNKKGKKTYNSVALGRRLRSALEKARSERRLVCGLAPSIRCLEKTPDDAVLCVLPVASNPDAATHIQTVLLQAVCYENCVPVLQVDSIEKLAQSCGLSVKNAKSDCACAIITRDDLNIEENVLSMSPSERHLTEFYESTLEDFPRPIIQLPI